MSVFDRIRKKDIHNTLDVINKLACSLISDSEPVMYGNALKVIVNAFESEHGLLALIDKGGDLVVEAMYGAVLKECTVDDVNKVKFLKDSWGGIWGHALGTKKIIFNNSGNFKIPKGHVKIDRVMVAPILYQEKVIGNIVLGNRDKDYTNEDADLLKALCIHMSPLIKARIDVDREKAKTNIFQKAVWDMLNYANMFVLLLDDEMNIKLINWSLATVLGFKNENEPIGRCWVDFLKPKDVEWIKAVHHSITYSTEEAEKYREVTNEVIALDGTKIRIKWFNAMINHNYNFTFSMGVYDEAEMKTEITEDSIRAFYRDVIEQDKVMITALKSNLNMSHHATCAPENLDEENGTK
jgi:PAS domain-containing protein